MMICFSCKSTTAPTVSNSRICTFRHQSIILEKQDFKNINQMNKNKRHKVTIKKLIKNITINHKEFNQ